MKVLIDIGHPAHVHYFRNLISLLKERDYEIMVIARDRYPILDLLDTYGVAYYSRGKGSNTKIGKLIYLFIGNLNNLYRSLIFNPDLLISHGGTYTAFISWLLRKKSITTEDTEHAVNSHKLALPFTTYMMTPSFFKKNLGKKQVRFNSFMELAYLHPTYFKPNKKVLHKYKLVAKKYILFRFVDWKAHHDNVTKILSDKDKIEIVNFTAKFATPIISSEGTLPDKISEYEIHIEPEDFHSLLHFAALHIGEGATTASESVLVGTPAIYINPLKVSNIDLQATYGLAFHLLDKNEIMKCAERILNEDINEYTTKWKHLLDENIDFTEYLLNFITTKIN